MKYVGENLLSILRNLNEIHFQNNPCVNDVAFSSRVPALVQKLKSQCKWPHEVLLVKEQCKKENVQKRIELNSKNSEILAMKTAKTRQANLLRTMGRQIIELINGSKIIAD